MYINRQTHQGKWEKQGFRWWEIILFQFLSDQTGSVGLSGSNEISVRKFNLKTKPKHVSFQIHFSLFTFKIHGLSLFNYDSSYTTFSLISSLGCIFLLLFHSIFVFILFFLINFFLIGCGSQNMVKLSGVGRIWVVEFVWSGRKRSEEFPTS